MRREPWSPLTVIAVTFMALALTLVAIIVAAGRPRRPALPLPLAVVEAGQVVRNPLGRVMAYDVRAVEPGVLYRGSGFPYNAGPRLADDPADVLPTMNDETVFNHLRALNVRHVFALQESAEDYYSEQGYFDFWAQQTGYRITTTWLPVIDSSTFGRDDRSSLHAAAEVIAQMKHRSSQDGAVWIHDDARGNDATGVVVAGYETWRNWGLTDAAQLWPQVQQRYLASNLSLSDPAIAPAAGGGHVCADPQSPVPSLVCGEWLEGLREAIFSMAQF